MWPEAWLLPRLQCCRCHCVALQNMAAQYHEFGYLYEQYDDASGQGKGSHPFNGWSALAALIAVEHY